MKRDEIRRWYCQQPDCGRSMNFFFTIVCQRERERERERESVARIERRVLIVFRGKLERSLDAANDVELIS